MWKWFTDIVADHAKKLIAGAIGAGAVAIAVPIWAFVQGSAKGFIVNTVVEESAKDGSSLSTSFEEIIRRVRQSESSAVSAGNFTLTPANRTFTLYLYFPEGYRGKFYYALKGNVAPKKRYVVLAPPTSKPIPLVQEQNSIILEKYFQPSTGQAAVIADIFEHGKASERVHNNLRSITFQLEGIETDEDLSPALAGSTSFSTTPKQSPENVAAIEISYVALVTPAPRSGEK
jgi:hypothetical protein